MKTAPRTTNKSIYLGLETRAFLWTDDHGKLHVDVEDYIGSATMGEDAAVRLCEAITAYFAERATRALTDD